MVNNTMRLWTIQPMEVVNILKHKEVYRCNTKLSENYIDFKDAYLWIAGEMDRRGIPHPKNVQLPLWAWHTRDWKHKKPDFRTVGLGTPNKKYACIEFEIPDNLALLSDYNAWHYVLNKSWFDGSTNEEEWNKLHNWYDSLKLDTQYKLTVDSWQKIFDITPLDNEWDVRGRYIQAVFWELRREMVKDIKYFKAR